MDGRLDLAHERASLRSLVQGDRILVAPGAYDVLSAILIQQAGFPCVYLGGNAATASTLGLPDLGLITMTEMRECVRRTAARVDLPIIVDADVGYGSLMLIQRTIREFEAAGASAIQIEDQVGPKKCGHELQREVVEVDEMIARLRAALDARRKQETLIVARTDARTTHGLKEAIRRGTAYAGAGADVVFVESPESEDEFREVARAIRAPLLANMVEGGRGPYLPWPRLQELGFKIAIYPHSAVGSAARAVQTALSDIREHGWVERAQERMLTLHQYHDVLRFQEYLATERAYRGVGTAAIPDHPSSRDEGE